MSGVELAACPFCGGAAKVYHAQNSFHDAAIQCGGCDASGPIFDIDDGGDDEWGRNEAEAIAAWNRRAVPMEAVAWRWIPTRKGKKEPWMVGDAAPWVYRTGAARPDFSACPAGDIQDLQALAVIPAPGNKEEGT